MNARSWTTVFAWEFSSARSASNIPQHIFFHLLNVSYRHFCVKVCFAHLSSVHTVALTAAGSQPCWKDSFQLIMTGQRKPPTSFHHMTGPVRLGRLPVTDGWLGQRLTSVSSFSSIRRAFSRGILSEPGTPPPTASLCLPTQSPQLAPYATHQRRVNL